MGIEEIWENYTSKERDIFQKTCRRLLKSTFIVREKDEEHKKAYYFISRNTEAFSAYFSYIGFDVFLDRENGVAMLQNCADTGENGRIQFNRVALKKVESILLCCLWILYADRMRSSSLSRVILVSVADLRFELEKYGIRDQIEKTSFSQALQLLSGYHLIDVIGKIGEPDCMIRLYPSLQFALDIDEFQNFAANASRRMMETAEETQMSEEEDVEEIEGNVDDFRKIQTEGAKTPAEETVSEGKTEYTDEGEGDDEQ